jgi:acetoin utilization protein AcuB
MLVRTYMTKHPLMADPKWSVVDARRYMVENGVRHLPVAGDGKRLLGLVTRQRLLADPGELGSLSMWEIADYLSNLKIRQVMIKRKHVFTASPEMTIEEAALVMVKNRIGSLPVIDDEIVVGIITETDLLAQLIEMLCLSHQGVRLTVRMPDPGEGELAKLVAKVAEQGWGIAALGGVPAPKTPGMWDAVIKIRDITVDEAVSALREVEGHQIIDARNALGSVDRSKV